MPLKKQKILITAALPYANASIHLGHLIEYIEADVITRFLRLTKKDAIYICASDTHGTPIEVNAAKLGIKPEEMVKKFNEEHKKDFADFLIQFDNYYTTHSPENKELSEFFFTTLNKKGFITKKALEVMYCPHCDRALPDRYVRGTCPNCGAADQYGDVCEACGIALKGIDLLNPRCSICGKQPKHKDSEHYFFRLNAFSDKLRAWLETNKNLQSEIKNHIREWLNKGLEDWCISRDGPYFGFLIPGETNKYFYVWLDAPIGYISSTQNFTKKWDTYWKGKNSRVIHFIGKDIIYFHFLFWPAMLMGVGFNLPSDIVVHGFLTVNGTKMSKSRGTFFTARDFLKLYNPEYLRFYYALHLSKKLVDVDLDFEDFKATINNKLVANVANFCYRVLSFIEKNYGGKVNTISSSPLVAEAQHQVEHIQKMFEEYNLKEALNGILALSDKGNAYFQNAAPWKSKDTARGEVGLAANIIRTISILISPILPRFAADIQKQLGEKNLMWDDITFNKKITVKKAAILFTKIEKIPSAMSFPLDLKVGEVVEVKDHPKADALYVLSVDVGVEKRQIVAGLKKYIPKDALLNKHILVCMNIIPATIRGVESKGMLLAADDGVNVVVVEAPKSKPGLSAGIEGYANATAPISFENFRKLKIRVIGKKVVWQSAHLRTEKEDITVSGVNDGAEVR